MRVSLCVCVCVFACKKSIKKSNISKETWIFAFVHCTVYWRFERLCHCNRSLRVCVCSVCKPNSSSFLFGIFWTRSLNLDRIRFIVVVLFLFSISSFFCFFLFRYLSSLVFIDFDWNSRHACTHASNRPGNQPTKQINRSKPTKEETCRRRSKHLPICPNQMDGKGGCLLYLIVGVIDSSILFLNFARRLNNDFIESLLQERPNMNANDLMTLALDVCPRVCPCVVANWLLFWFLFLARPIWRQVARNTCQTASWMAKAIR